jgi:LysM repeat protein
MPRMPACPARLTTAALLATSLLAAACVQPVPGAGGAGGFQMPTIIPLSPASTIAETPIAPAPPTSMPATPDNSPPGGVSAGIGAAIAAQGTAVAQAAAAAGQSLIIVTATPLPPMAAFSLAVTEGPPISGPPATQAPIVAGTAQTITHVIATGETLYRIATRYGTTVEAVMAANGLADPDAIFAGQSLTILAASMPSPDAPSPAASSTAPASATATATPLASSTLAAPSPTASLVPSPTPGAPLATAPPPTPVAIGPEAAAINGVALERYLLMSPQVQTNVRNIFLRGRGMGRDPRSFTKIGDSLIEPPFFMGRFDEGVAVLGPYDFLQATIDQYAGWFAHESAAVRRGLHSWAVFDPMWADDRLCTGNEDVLACELRRANPSILFIKLGSNDAGRPDTYDENLRRIVEVCIQNGVVPVLSTKADRHEGSDINNQVVRQIAADYLVPLWDFDLLATTMPERGLEGDGVHLKVYYAYDYTQATAFQRGHGVHNLAGLIILDQLWRLGEDAFAG